MAVLGLREVAAHLGYAYACLEGRSVPSCLELPSCQSIAPGTSESIIGRCCCPVHSRKRADTKLSDLISASRSLVRSRRHVQWHIADRLWLSPSRGGCAVAVIVAVILLIFDLLARIGQSEVNCRQAGALTDASFFVSRGGSPCKLVSSRDLSARVYHTPMQP